MDPLDVSAPQLLASSGAFTDIADTAREIGNGVVKGWEDLGDFAGTDSFGRAFTEAVAPAVAGLGSGLIGLGAGMDGTADGLKQSAVGYEKADAAAADDIHPLQ